jgi:hypothetical protein
MSRWAPDLGAARVIGSGRTVAMLRRDATIDWWCPSTFDDPPLCWQLLDPHGGVATFQLAALLTSRDAYRPTGAVVAPRTSLPQAPGHQRQPRWCGATPSWPAPYTYLTPPRSRRCLAGCESGKCWPTALLHAARPRHGDIWGFLTPP